MFIPHKDRLRQIRDRHTPITTDSIGIVLRTGWEMGGGDLADFRTRRVKIRRYRSGSSFLMRKYILKFLNLKWPFSEKRY